MPEYKANDPFLPDELFEGSTVPGEELAHYGILRKSGRYPWGMGGDDSAAGRARRGIDFLTMVKDLESQGLSRGDVARGLGFESTTQLRDAVTIANNARRRADQLEAEKLRAKGWSATAIGQKMGRNESSVRELLNPSVQERTMVLENTVNVLRSEVDKGGWLDIGRGTEYYIPGGGLSKEKLRAAVAVLKDEGYEQIDVQTDTSTKNKTTIKTLCPPGTTYKDVVTTKDQIRTLTKITDDGGRSWTGDLPPLSISKDRVKVVYKEDGGANADGVIYVRPGVKDVNIGGSSYAQVRISVDGTHYLKGMAMYKDNMPPGVDLEFHTNKSKNDPKILKEGKLGAMKPQSEDKNDPFGAVIARQITELDKNGKERVTSALNILQEEGSWDKWSRKLSSQVLSKQNHKLAEQQLNKSYVKKKEELDEILSLTNPTVRAHLLDKFSDSADSDAVHLHAAGLPRSSYHVILPFNSLKDTEIYAPNFDQGDRVALIRYPHGGTFEIPELIVNNNAPGPKAAIGRAKDAVGINAKVAERLSGADFDGDFVMVIRNNDSSIKSTSALKQLEGFDPQRYKLPDDAPKMKPRTKGKQMGDVSNLITDMTIQKAGMEEISRAVRHSMVVIDAEKHHLDWQRSAKDFGIHALKVKYQGINPNTGQPNGASTLISRATSQERVPHRRARRSKEGGPIDPATGELRFEETGKMRTKVVRLKNGEKRYEKVPVLVESTKLAETTDARTLLSDNGGTLIERVYADHSNRMKALANASRKEMVNNTRPIVSSPSAKKIYKEDVAQLKADLHVALMNSPRERAAQVLTGTIVAQKKAANPQMTKEEEKKVRSQALKEARFRTGAKKDLVPITPRQWDAIQAGAVSTHMLKQILDNADIEKIKEYATPKPDIKMDSTNLAKARSLRAAGMTQAEVAKVLGVSLTTLKKGLDDG